MDDTNNLPDEGGIGEAMPTEAQAEDALSKFFDGPETATGDDEETTEDNAQDDAEESDDEPLDGDESEGDEDDSEVDQNEDDDDDQEGSEDDNEETDEESMNNQGFNLQPGDTVLLCTDGLIDQPNAEGERYGEQRFLEQLEEGRLLSPAELERRILADVAAFGGEPHDDTTLLILRM